MVLVGVLYFFLFFLFLFFSIIEVCFSVCGTLSPWIYARLSSALCIYLPPVTSLCTEEKCITGIIQELDLGG